MLDLAATIIDSASWWKSAEGW